MKQGVVDVVRVSLSSDVIDKKIWAAQAVGFHLLFVFFIGVMILIGSGIAYSYEKVRVAGYVFPPFVNPIEDGISQDMVRFLNARQRDFIFEFQELSPKRRYSRLLGGKADAIFFEMPVWGWQVYEGQFDESRTLLVGGEVYVAKNGLGRDQTYFDILPSRRLALMLGYHYGFADFNSDQMYLEERFDVQFGETHAHNLNLIQVGRADVAVVTKAFLSRHFQKNPRQQPLYLVSEKFDQEYKLPILTMKHSPVSVEWITEFLDAAKADGSLVKFFEDRGVGQQLVW